MTLHNITLHYITLHYNNMTLLYCRGVTKSSNSYSRRPCQPPTPLVTHPTPLSFENNLGIHICATIIEIWAHTHEKDMGVEQLQLKQLLKQKFL